MKGGRSGRDRLAGGMLFRRTSRWVDERWLAVAGTDAVEAVRAGSRSPSLAGRRPASGDWPRYEFF